MNNKNWFQRNWKWFVPCGCLTLLVCTVGFAVAIFFGVSTAMKSSEPYSMALEMVRADQRVTDAMGTPIEAGRFVMGSINVSGGSGQANLSIPVEGPLKEGEISVEANKRHGMWEMDHLSIKIGDDIFQLIPPQN